MSNKACLLVLIVAPEIQEALVDWLLAREEIFTFSEQDIRGHSREHGAFSLVEQVTGRQRRVMFHIQTTENNAQEILSTLADEFPRCGLNYWLIPMLDAGRIPGPDQ